MLNCENNQTISNVNEGIDNKYKYIHEIKHLMEYIIANNNNNKKNKFSLYRIRGFEPHSIFYEIDKISSGIINFSDLDEYLSKNNIKIDKDIILLFIREFNKEGNDNNLTIKDFISFLNYDINKNKISIGEKEFDKNEIHNLFLDLIKLECKLIKEKNDLINEIKKIKEFSTFEAFYIISNDNKFIDYDCLKSFLGNKYKKNEIKELIYRIDLNNNGKISYDEFQDLFFPFQEHLHLEEANEEDIYKINNDSNYDVAINYKEDYNLSPYKGNSLSEPKIINYNINNIDEDDNQEIEQNNKLNNKDNSKSDIFLNSNQSGKNYLNDDNYINDINYKYDNDNLVIKYDEELIKDINIKEKNNDKDYIYNNDEKKNEKNQLKEHFSFYEKPNTEKINKNNVNIQNNQNINLQTKPKNESKIYNLNIFNDNLVNNDNYYSNNKYSQNKEKIEKINIINRNFTDIFSEKDKSLIHIFIDYIHSITLLESKSENFRESISLCDDISLIEIFEQFDKTRKNLISKIDFQEGCNKVYFLFPLDSQIKLLYERYDLDNDGNLNFEEFMNMISPLKKEYFALCEKEEIKNNITFESKKKIIEFLKIIIDNETFNYELRTKLIANEIFNFINLWGLLMKYSKNNQELNKEEFKYFLESFGSYLTQYELDIIFFKLSKGKNEIRYDDLFKNIIV